MPDPTLTMPDPAEYEIKPCTVPGCPGTMVLSMRAVPVGGSKRRPGWLCGKNQTHIEWVFGLAT